VGSSPTPGATVIPLVAWRNPNDHEKRGPTGLGRIGGESFGGVEVAVRRCDRSDHRRHGRCGRWCC